VTRGSRRAPKVSRKLRALLRPSRFRNPLPGAPCPRRCPGPSGRAR
jgi:hypothetical protein